MIEMKSDRILNRDTVHHSDESVTVVGWVHTIRSHGKLVFLDLRDRSGILQVVINQNISQDAYSTAQELRPEYVVEIQGVVHKRPQNAVNTEIETGTVELEATHIKILSKSETLPFDMGAKDLDLQLPTLLDFRSLTLRHEKVRAIFKVQEALVEGFRKVCKHLECTEVFVPTISASATEGGAELFKFKYYDNEAYLVQSPQLYKQIMVSVFERVYLISHIYRAEPSVTTRHLSESIQLDVEMGFIEHFEELLDAMEFIYSETISHAQESCAKELALLGVEKSKIVKKIPRLTMHDAQELIHKRTGVDHRNELDLTPDDERGIAKWALEEHESDLVTITHFPTKKRAFYSMPDPKNPELSLSYDILYKGLEISSGAQRVHEFDQLVEIMKGRALDPKNFTMYLMAFTYGIPPHGGFSFGLERSTMKLLNLQNIREASLFPRDMERVDERF